MNSLGFLGSMYMFFLLALLVVALGAGASYLVHSLSTAITGKRANTSSPNNQNKTFKGGYTFMENNPLLRYALYSFLGILLLMVIAGILTPNQSMNNQMMSMGNGMPYIIMMVPSNNGMPMGNMAMGQMPMGVQGGGMGMMGMPMGMQSNGMGMMGQMPMGMQSGGMGMMGQMPMGMQSGGMGNMQGNNMSNMQSSGGGMGMMGGMM